ncbi:MAG: glycosyltransferase [Microbacterium sp.]|uniref:glycosyltransferase family 2 protein n=1 Tax=Microbacterium sp. TaxID=51671 RepID=UPI001AC5A473|nr:glycosyltransferase [Microbacterium sp.]MBN9178527.1 glycosyltransferase [Microbacterium sp.]
MSDASPVRVLLAVTFYNGRSFARRTMESIARLQKERFALDVLVLDDASPEPGFSEHLEALAAEFGAVYYRSPRNMGIPRNVNLGLATAQRLGYDYVVISNSDVIYAQNALQVLVDDAVSSAAGVASITAWSTNVDPYSLPNGADLYVETQDVADLIGVALAAEFADRTLDIPAGISFAMIVPVAVLDEVGLMDPVFGRGYGEESDWSARASSAGYKHLLAQGSYVYHAGRGSTLAAGIVSKDATADWGNQRIVNHRSPMFRWDVDGFLRSGTLEPAQIDAVRALVLAAASKYGYALIDASKDWVDPAETVVTVAIRSQAYEICTAHWCGFTTDIDTDGSDVVGAIVEFFGGVAPLYTNVRAATWQGASQFGYPVRL